MSLLIFRFKTTTFSYFFLHRREKGLRLLFLPNVPKATFIPGSTYIPELRVGTLVYRIEVQAPKKCRRENFLKLINVQSEINMQVRHLVKSRQMCRT